jgi:hypothetical protein
MHCLRRSRVCRQLGLRSREQGCLLQGLQQDGIFLPLREEVRSMGLKRKARCCTKHPEVELQKIRVLPKGKTRGRGKRAWYCRLCGE